MRFVHDAELLTEFPQLSAAALVVDGVTGNADVVDPVSALSERAAARLSERPEGEFPEIAAWRRAFSQMGLKPTQYRCASEALLRRFRKDGALPSIHPLVDLCNAASLAYAIPVAVFDLDHIEGDLTVRRATGTESYLTFGGETENPEPGEVIFADGAGRAHARRWTNRQSARSAVGAETRRALVVSETMHETGQKDVSALRAELSAALDAHWNVVAA